MNDRSAIHYERKSCEASQIGCYKSPSLPGTLMCATQLPIIKAMDDGYQKLYFVFRFCRRIAGYNDLLTGNNNHNQLTF